jgi:hypothetical protein
MHALHLLFHAVIAQNQTRQPIQRVLEAEVDKVVEVLVGRLDGVVEDEDKAGKGQARHVVELYVLGLPGDFVEKHGLASLSSAGIDFDGFVRSVCAGVKTITVLPG